MIPPVMRKQYHLRASERGLLAWDVHGLVERTAALEPVQVPLAEIRELDLPFWFSGEDDVPTCRRVAEHARLIQETSLAYPIILDPEGRVLDGMHRVCKALIEGRASIEAFRLPSLPEPDYVGVPVDELPY